MKNYITAGLFSAAIVLAAYLVSHAYLSRTTTLTEGTVVVTGLGQKDIVSDLIVWEGRFTTRSSNLKEAYNALNEDKKKVLSYFQSKGIASDLLVFDAVLIQRNFKSNYSEESGKYLGEEFVDYSLDQNIRIESNDVNKIEKISREITELLNQGVQFNSDPPRYYYTKLADLKVEMVSAATKDAYDRANIITQQSNSKLGQLISAQMGVFQITGRNSAEEYSWGGTLNTSSRDKTTSITMRLTFKVE